MSLEGGLPTPGPAPHAPAAGPPSGSAPTPQRTQQPTELDEFLARAVDRQIAEQRALRESLQELSAAVRELQSRPPPAPPTLDLGELDARIRRGMEANAQNFTAQLREFSASILPEIARASEGAKGSRAIEHDLSILRDAIGGLSADVEGIAQALIDLNAGLREWAEGVDRNMDGVRATIEDLRELTSRTQQLQSDAVKQQVDALAAAEERLVSRQAEAIAVVEERFAAQPEIAVGEVVEPAEPELTVPPPVAVAEPVELAPPRDFTSEIEQRVKETIELSLYLADQIEGFDKVLGNLGDLPTRLEGVIAQALKRTLAARAKLDREAETALDEVVATLDEHVATIGDLSFTAEGIRQIATGQAELATGLHALAEAIDRSSEGRAPRARSAIAKSTRRFTSDEDLPRAAPARKKTTTGSRKTAKGTAASKTSKGKAKTPRSSAPGRGKRKGAPRKPAGTDYIDIDAD